MKNKKKGFTLVELIVVLAILAILAAMLVPALTGYIDKANNQKVVATTRQVVMAAQSTISEKYATIASDDPSLKAEQTITSGDLWDEIVVLSEVGSRNGNDVKLKNGVTSVTIKYFKGNVTSAEVMQNGKKCTYNASTGQYS